MTNKSYPEEFKIEAVKQITERGHKVAEVSARIGVSQQTAPHRSKVTPLPPRIRPTAFAHAFLA